MKRVFYSPLRLVSRVLGKLQRTSLKLERACEPGDIQQRRIFESTSYSMVEAQDEPYYAEQYWRVLSPRLTGVPRDATVLDLGCGQRGFSLKLAEFFPAGKVLGCDISRLAIARRIDER